MGDVDGPGKAQVLGSPDVRPLAYLPAEPRQLALHPPHNEAPMPSDIEIAQSATLQPIETLARERLGIASEHLSPYGRYKAKLSLDFIDTLTERPDGELALVDMNDRALRSIVSSLGGPGNGFPRVDGFDIVVASEVMAILCLATSIDDPRARLARIIVGRTRDGRAVTASELTAHGAMTVLLREALAPNLVQTLEHTPAFVHGGPFANIAHSCNSGGGATRVALKLADYVVTEAGFGADLDAEKFLDIKCRASGLKPSAAVVVATVRALKYHGGADLKTLTREDLGALEKGLVNLERHVDNVKRVYGIPCVVSINRFDADTAAEIALIRERMSALGVDVVLATHWAEGGAGAAELARVVVRLCDQPSSPEFVYPDDMSLWDKLRALATRVYRAADVRADATVRGTIDRLQAEGWGHLPICIANTQMSFSNDPSQRGAPEGHTLDVREVRLSAGAGFIVMICGDIMTMPGLPKEPATARIDWVNGKVVGLS